MGGLSLQWRWAVDVLWVETEEREKEREKRKIEERERERERWSENIMNCHTHKCASTGAADYDYSGTTQTTKKGHKSTKAGKSDGGKLGGKLVVYDLRVGVWCQDVDRRRERRAGGREGVCVCVCVRTALPGLFVAARRP